MVAATLPQPGEATPETGGGKQAREHQGHASGGFRRRSENRRNHFEVACLLKTSQKDMHQKGLLKLREKNLNYKSVDDLKSLRGRMEVWITGAGVKGHHFN